MMQSDRKISDIIPNPHHRQTFFEGLIKLGHMPDTLSPKSSYNKNSNLNSPNNKLSAIDGNLRQSMFNNTNNFTSMLKGDNNSPQQNSNRIQLPKYISETDGPTIVNSNTLGSPEKIDFHPSPKILTASERYDKGLPITKNEKAQVMWRKLRLFVKCWVWYIKCYFEPLYAGIKQCREHMKDFLSEKLHYSVNFLEAKIYFILKNPLKKIWMDQTDLNMLTTKYKLSQYLTENSTTEQGILEALQNRCRIVYDKVMS